MIGDEMSIKKLQNLTIEDNFMFQKVMQDESILEEAIKALGLSESDREKYTTVLINN